jgi:quercetin dioxygenase-like cupin family protein
MSTTDSPAGALPAACVQRMAAVVEVAPGAIVSRTLMRTDGGNVTAFAFDSGQALSEHSAPFDALVHLLDGVLVVSIAGEEHRLAAGEAILMPANVPHAVRAPSPSRWLLVMLKSLKRP